MIFDKNKSYDKQHNPKLFTQESYDIFCLDNKFFKGDNAFMLPLNDYIKNKICVIHGITFRYFIEKFDNTICLICKEYKYKMLEDIDLSIFMGVSCTFINDSYYIVRGVLKTDIDNITIDTIKKYGVFND